MKKLNSYIDESIFGGKSEDEITQGAEDAAIIGELKKMAYDNLVDVLQRISPFMPDFGSVKVGKKGFDIEMYTTRGRYPEFVLDCKSKLPLPFERLVVLDEFKNSPKPNSGTIIIQHYNGKDLTELFTKDCHLRSLEVFIRNCPNLENLNGLPKNTQITNLDIQNCMKLKDISDLTPVLNLSLRRTSVNSKSIKQLSKNVVKMMRSLTLYLSLGTPTVYLDGEVLEIEKILRKIYPNQNIKVDVW